MDGIETAITIKENTPRVRIIFLTAHDNADYRNRAAKANLRIERWLDKGAGTIAENAQMAVWEARSNCSAEVVLNRIHDAATAAHLDTNQTEIIKQYLTPYSLLPPSRLLFSEPTRPVRKSVKHVLSEEPDPPVPVTLDQVLCFLLQILERTEEMYPDPSGRNDGWMRFRETVSNHIWAAAEALPDHEYHQQLAVQLEQAVSRIDSALLTREHIRAIYLSIERLRSPHVDATDVAACKKAWRKAGLETLPSFRQILTEWEELYNVAEFTEESGEDTSRDNDPITPDCR